MVGNVTPRHTIALADEEEEKVFYKNILDSRSETFSLSHISRDKNKLHQILFIRL